MKVLFVIAGAVVGAPLRYLTDRAIQSRHDGDFPWGTFTVNVVGSAILGFVVGASTTADAPHWVQLLVGTGFCGALTTYSTFSYETLRLWEQNARLPAIANLTASILAALGAAYLGVTLSLL
ncbi:fluoride efflux transporter CrcB [Kribbella sp. NPDC051620]|uniref:fluoride efflux transporter CrcB n=1 Tax=Kribbella sp. NPDC051620 TaxID=3364120 RepID=UPI0037923EF0